MASNDGSRLIVFGLTFRQHDNRQMQHILRQHGRLLSNPGNRAALYTSLFDLSRSLDDDEAQGIEEWLQNGGAADHFPVPRSATPASATEEGFLEVNTSVQESDSEIEEGEEWPEYHLEHFQAGDFESEDGYPDEEIDEYHPDESIDREGGLEELGSDHSLDDLPIDGDEMGTASHEYTSVQNEVPLPVKNECQICTVEVESNEKFAPTNITSTCKHLAYTKICLDCVQQHIQEKIQSGALSHLNCLWCDEEFSPQDIKKYALPADFARYEYLILISHPDIVMCLSTTCSAGQLHTDAANPKMICNTCSFATYAYHKVPWHEAQTCEEFDCSDEQIERLEHAELTAKLLAKDQSKICPNCRQGVTRTEGCDHLSCNCGESWCFLCLASWDNIMRIGKEAHAPTCPSNPRYIPRTKAELAAAGQAQFADALLGRRASEALLRARDARNERLRAELRPKALEAAEARMKAEQERTREEDRNESRRTKKRKLRLLPAWEER